MAKRLSINGLFLALICISGFLSIPLSIGISITLQFLVILLAFCLIDKLGDKLIITTAYALLGLFLPIFSGFQAGLTPTYGYILGFIFASIPFHFIIKIRSINFSFRYILASFAALFTIYVIGGLFFNIYTNKGFDILSILSYILLSTSLYILFDITKIFVVYIILITLPKSLKEGILNTPYLFNGKDIKLVIFDLDGTLINSTSIWNDVDKEFFKRRGMQIPPNYGKEIAHIGLVAAAKLTKEKYLPNEEIDDILNEWNSLSLKAYKETLKAKPFAITILKYFYNRGIKIALATANSSDLYLPCLKRLKINKYFSYIVDVNSCKSGKDNPEIYDKVAEYFNVKRDETIVFEDSLTAIKTAHLSGYNVVAVYDKNSTKNICETKSNSDKLITNFLEMTFSSNRIAHILNLVSAITLSLTFISSIVFIIYLVINIDFNNSEALSSWTYAFAFCNLIPLLIELLLLLIAQIVKRRKD